MKKKAWLWILAGLIAAGIVFGGVKVYQNHQAQVAAAAQVKRYVTQPAIRADVGLTVSGTGSVAAATSTDVKPQQTGTVDKILAKNGDQVQAGQPIVVLKNDSVLASLASSQASLQQAQDALAAALNVDPVTLQQAQAKVTSDQSTASQRQQDVTNLTVTAPISGVVISTAVQPGDSVGAGGLVATIFDDQHPEVTVDVPQYVADAHKVGDTVTVYVDGADAGGQSATLTAAGPVVTASGHSTQVPLTLRLSGPLSGLYPGAGAHTTLQDSSGADYAAYGAVSTTGVTVRAQVAGQVAAVGVGAGDRVSVGQTIAKLKNDTAQAALTQAGSDLAVAQEQLSRLENPAAAPGSDIKSLQLKVQAAQDDLQAKQDAVDQLTVRAPFAGTISSLNLLPGDSAAGNTVLFHLADPRAKNVVISVDELDIARVAVGQTADVTLDALPNKPYTAKVSYIDPEGVSKNDIANFNVTLTFDNVQGLMDGMTANANVTVETHKNVVAVPVAAVVKSRRGSVVRVLPPGSSTPQTVPVTVGLTGNDLVEITSGINEGDRVVVADITPKSTSSNILGGLGGGARGGGAGGFGGGGFGGGAPGGGGTRSSSGGQRSGN